MERFGCGEKNNDYEKMPHVEKVLHLQTIFKCQIRTKGNISGNHQNKQNKLMRNI